MDTLIGLIATGVVMNVIVIAVILLLLVAALYFVFILLPGLTFIVLPDWLEDRKFKRLNRLQEELKHHVDIIPEKPKTLDT
ncbi:MAG: hypothetical protein CL770_03780 [Chloroflexi bacterium]|nr:hypothetical protein [Chloroflexota bacterium]|tara:strand:- start:122 stop:364 length:243 start_codon:yes stop_codon:yes gene_type:complete